MDIGCGNGRNMNRKNLDFTGVDNCPEFINICKSNNQNVILSDMCNLPFQNESFDGIMLIASYHHLSTVDRRIKCLEEIHRILKYNGKCLLSVWSKNQPKKTKRVFNNYGDTLVKWQKNNDIFNRYYYIFHIDEIKKLFEKSNLKIEKHEWICGNEVFVIYK